MYIASLTGKNDPALFHFERQLNMRKESTIDDAEIKRQVEYARTLKEEEINTSAPDAHVMSEEKWANARPFREVF